MDYNRVYGRSRGQGPDQGLGAKARQQEDSRGFSQRGRQEESYNPIVKRDEFNGGLKDKQSDQNPSGSQKRKQDDLFAQQKGKQEDLFAQQKGRQDDLFAQQRGKQEDLFPQPKGKQENLFAQPKEKQEDLFAQQKGKQEDLFAQKKGKQEDLFAQPKGKQENLFSQPKAKQEDLFAQQKGKQENLFAQPKTKQEDLFAQPKGKPEDLFAEQKGKQQDLFAHKGKQEDLFAQRESMEDLSLDNRNNQRPETSLRVEEKSYEGSRRSYNNIAGDSQRGEREGRDTTFGDFLSSNVREYSRPWNMGQHHDSGGDSELHGGHELTHNPALQTMVKMVTMLNFMKVELGETKTLKSKEQWRAAGAEFVGTFLFIYIGCGSVVATGMIYSEMTPSRLVAIALAHGLAIACLVGATGALSGGHLNPAITLAFVVAGKENLVRAGLYVTAQLFGAIFGALFLQFSTPEYLRGNLGAQDISEFIFTSQGFLMETILTFALVFVIFGVAVDRRGPGVIAPLPIGFVVVADHLVGVPYTGASMNPARSFGPALVSGYFGSAHLVYWVAPCFGATMASALYRYAFLEPAEAAAQAVATSTSPR